MLRFREPRNHLIFSFGTFCGGLFFSGLMNIVPFWITIACGSVGILAILFAILNDIEFPKKPFKLIMVWTALLLVTLTVGIPQYLSMERTAMLYDLNPSEWKKSEVKLVDMAILDSSFIEGHVYLFTPVIKNGKPHSTLLQPGLYEIRLTKTGLTENVPVPAWPISPTAPNVSATNTVTGAVVEFHDHKK